ncbi:MAG: aminotransferase class I/II-fold pyridoxal phosphate-dependent enzyme [Candidatus Thorarchaeota archaeon]|jgi:aspartate aminotransferase
MLTLYSYIEMIRKHNPEIRLDIGQPDFPVDVRIIDAAIEALREGKTRYTSGYGIPELRQALAEKHDVDQAQVFVTAGGKLPIYATIETCSKAAVIHPGWPAYEEILKIKSKPYTILHTSFEDSFLPSFHELDKNVDLVLTNYPNNPTGTILPREKMKELVDICNDNHITLLADEIYSFLTFDTFTSFQEFDCDHFIYIGSFSKSASMTGFRLGYAISSPEQIEVLQNIQAHVVTCPVEFAQWAALRALEIEDDLQRQTHSLYSKRKRVAEKTLTSVGIEYLPCQGAFYLFPQIPLDSQTFCTRLLEKGVSVVPGHFFGEYPHNFRISLVSDRLEEAIHRMEDVLTE